jgi:hypothetical protein
MEPQSIFSFFLPSYFVIVAVNDIEGDLRDSHMNIHELLIGILSLEPSIVVIVRGSIFRRVISVELIAGLLVRPRGLQASIRDRCILTRTN